MQFQHVYSRERAVPLNPDNLRITDEEAQAGARMAIRLFDLWDLTDSEACILLGGLGARTYSRWKKGQFGNIDVDRRTRLSILAGIHKALKYLFTDNARAYGWVKKPNSHFDEARALDIMLNGRITDLMAIRDYLDAVRG